MKTSSRIYVAGHTGLVGSAIVRALRRRGYRNLLTVPRAELDLRRQADVVRWMLRHRPEYIFMAAARVGGIEANRSQPADFIRDNLLIAANVIDAAHAAGVKKICFLGSSCVYPRHAPQPISESALMTGPLEPTNEAYAVAKIAGIVMLQSYYRQYGMESVIAMPSNVYGPGDNFDLGSGHVLAALLRKFHLARRVQVGDVASLAIDEQRHGPIPDDVLAALDVRRSGRGFERIGRAEPRVVVWGTGTPRREFLHSDDVAEACLLLMQQVGGAEIVNVGLGADISIRELASLIAEAVGYDGPIEWDASKPDGMPRKLLDVRRLHALGWRPSVDLREGIRQVYHAEFTP